MTGRLPPVIFLLGPTASGKSDLAIAIAERLDAEIVSVDSAMVYRGMDIGTAKPDRATRERVPHALIDIRDPWQDYSAADFRTDCLASISRIRAAGRPVVLVGGTSLYFRALEHGLSDLPARDEAVRVQIRDEAGRIGWPALHQRLTSMDPARGAQIHANDQQRIERALEIAEVTGRLPSELRGGTVNTGGPELSPCKIVVAPESRAELHARIEQRLSQMMTDGLLQEVETLAGHPEIGEASATVRAVGYRQLWPVVKGQQSVDNGFEQAKVATRQLAKRQLTWLRHQAGAPWLVSGRSGNLDRALVAIEQFVST